MNFKEIVANYVLGNMSKSQLTQIGLIGLEENLESESLVILAGMNENANSFEIEEYYKNALVELELKEPNDFEASKVLLAYYLKEMIVKPETAFKQMVRIDNDIYNQVDWSSFRKEKPKYVGEELGLEKLYTWYREIQDCYDDLSNGIERLKFEEHLIEEAKALFERLGKV